MVKMKTEETNPAPLGEEKKDFTDADVAFANSFQRDNKHYIQKESLGESSEEQKTSADWYLQYPEPIVMDPDGWDRKNWQFSWYEEKITLREFEKRRLMSTVRLNTIRPPSPTSEHPEEQEEYRKGFNDAIDVAKNLMYQNGRQSEGHMISKLKKS